MKKPVPPESHEIMNHIFGPVPSRRLGRSLGIDVIPAKTCSFDCIYCESGPTTHLSVKRENFFDPAEVLRQLDEFFRRSPRGADTITFSSAGEPSLYLQLGELIRQIKKKYRETPLALLTNGSLLWDDAVRKDLLEADIVVPSLDAATPGTFSKINRPHPSLRLDEVIEGIRAFRKDYRGRLHLEIMLVSDVNDSPEELSALAREAGDIDADVIELNTVARPPAIDGTRGLPEDRMRCAASFFPQNKTSIIGTFREDISRFGDEDLAARILQTIERRPCTIRELSASLGVAEELLKAESIRLRDSDKLIMLDFGGKFFLCPPSRTGCES